MIETIVTGIIGITTTVVSWFLAKRKYNAEVDKSVLENMQKTLDIYKQISDDNKLRVAEACEESAVLRKENTALKNEVEDLKRQNKDLKKEIGFLKDQLLKVTSTICLDLSCQLRTKDFSTVTENIADTKKTHKKSNK